MSAELKSLYDRLIERFNELSDVLASPFELLVYLIGWVEDRRDATAQEYRQEMHRVKRDGIVWPTVRIIEEVAA